MGLSDHVCWTFDSDAEFDAAVVALARDAIEQGARVLFAGRAYEPELRARLVGLGDLDSLIDDGAVVVQSLECAYEDPVRVRVEALLARCERETERALAAGFRALRAIGDLTPLAQPVEQRRDLVRFEQLMDRFATDNPFSAACGYDRRVLGDTVVDVACVHPLVHAPEGLVPFRLYERDGALLLDGETDALTSDLLDRVLGHVDAEDDVVLDLSDCDFIEHRSLGVLADHARRFADDGVRFTVRSDSKIVRTMRDVLGYADLEIV